MQVNSDRAANLFTVSHQKWKFSFLIVLIISQIILFVLVFWSAQKPGDYFVKEPPIDDIYIWLFNVLHGAIFFTWFAFALRCPSCGKPIFWYIMRHREQRDFVALIKTSLVDGCPICNVNYAQMKLGKYSGKKIIH